ncbi:MAG: hypothetical protein OSJ62_10390 [Lachnospiraceae bacterium]|nr:hypothetical protein [Lachnospiraceae bacterium]
MLTQFFGSYLIDKNIISSDQLLEALRYKNAHAKKLGDLAVSAGYMSKDESDEVHAMQTQSDKKFAEIAVHMGYLTVAQADELINAQHTGYLLLGNSLIELGFCSQETISKAIADYEFDYQLSFSTILNSDSDKQAEMIQNYYHFPETEDINPMKEYATLLLKDLIRFIGGDFRLLAKIDAIPDTLPNMIEIHQKLFGKHNFSTSIIGFQDFMIQFAARYACVEFDELDEFADASLQDFLNLHNGIYTVTMSNEHGMEYELSPTETTHYVGGRKWDYILPIEFTFGTIYFCGSQNNS